MTQTTSSARRVKCLSAGIGPMRISIGALLALIVVMLADVAQAQAPDAKALMQRGKTRLGRSDNVGAVLDFSTVINLEPENAEAYFLRGRAKDGLRIPNYAVQDYTRAIALNPNYGEAYEQRAIVQYYDNVGNLDDALADFEKAVQLGIKSPDLYGIRGAMLRNIGAADGAVRDLTRAKELGDFFASVDLGLLHLYLGDAQSAVEEHSKDIASKSPSPSSYLYRGGAYRVLGEDAAAQRDFDKYLELQPNNEVTVESRKKVADALKAEPQPESAEDFVNRADTLYALDKVAAIYDCVRAAAIEPTHAAAYLTIGDARYDLKYLTSAAAAYGEAIQHDPQDPDSFYYRARAYWQAKNNDAAGLADCAKALEVEPRHLRAWNMRGVILQDNQLKFAEAAEAFAKALEINPADSVVQYNLGYAYNEIAEYALALPALNKSLEINANYYDALITRSKVRQGLGDTKGALEDLAKAMELAPQDAWVCESRALVHMQAGDLAAAQADLKQASTIDPYDAEAYRLMALVKELQGDMAGAMEQADKALSWSCGWAENYLTRGLLRLRAGKMVEAERDLADAVKLKPQLKERIAALTQQAKSGTAALALLPPQKKAASAGTSIAGETKQPAPVTVLKPVVTKAPAFAQKIFDSALKLYDQGEYERADAEFRRAVTLFPRYAEAHMYRGLIQLRLGSLEEAERMFGECLRIQPEFKATIDEQKTKIPGSK